MTKRARRAGAARGREGEQGMASIVVVSVLIIIITLISIGFARLVNRAAINSANKQFSAAATYAAQSGINDVASYLKKYAAANPGSAYLPQSTKCNGPGSLIGDSQSDPFFSDSDLSGNGSVKYTCILLNPNPTNLLYTSVNNLKSQVVKVNTSASASALDKLLISWQPSDSQVTGYPSGAGSLTDETAWNSPGGLCGASASCVPMLRVSIFPISNGETITSAQAQSKTLFLYPQSSGALVKSFGSLSDGSIVPVPCGQGIGSGNFNLGAGSVYKCNLVVSSLVGAIAPASTDSVYLRLTPMYNQADIQLATNDKFGNALKFINDQALVDVTAQVGGVVKRLQARIDTSSLVNGAGGIDTNISSNSDEFPEQSIRSANALCKRLDLHKSPYSYVSLNDSGVCGNVITVPPPQLQYLKINNVDSQDNTPVTGGCVNPLPLSQAASGNCRYGTIYVSKGTNATITWQDTDAADGCSASGNGWSGDQNAGLGFSGATATGSKIVTINSYSVFGLTCVGPGGTAATRTVYAAVPPDAVTGGADLGGGSSTKWTLNGTVNPNGIDTSSCVFQWDNDSTIDSDSQQTNCSSSPGSGTTPQGVSVLVDLDSAYKGQDTNGQSFYYRLCAQNLAGQTCGDVKSFTAAAPPVVTTEDDSHCDSSNPDCTTSASDSSVWVMYGTVNPNGLDVTNCYIHWDNDNDGYSSGSEWTAASGKQGCTSPPLPITGSSAVKVMSKTDIGNTNESNSATIYYQQCATNGVGTICGSLQSFTAGTGSSGGSGGTGGGGGGTPVCYATADNNGFDQGYVVGGDCQPNDGKNYWTYSAKVHTCYYQGPSGSALSCDDDGNTSGNGSSFTYADRGGDSNSFHWKASISVTFTIHGTDSNGSSTASATTSWGSS